MLDKRFPFSQTYCNLFRSTRNSSNKDSFSIYSSYRLIIGSHVSNNTIKRIDLPGSSFVTSSSLWSTLISQKFLPHLPFHSLRPNQVLKLTMQFATSFTVLLLAACTPALAALKLLNMNFNLCGNALYHDSNAYPLRRKTACEFYTSSNRISLPNRKSSSSKYDGIIPLKANIVFTINDYRCIYIQEKAYSKAEAMAFGRNDDDRIGYVSCQNQKIKGDTFVKDCFKSYRVSGGKCANKLPKGAPSCIEVSHCYTLGGIVKDAPKEFLPDQPLTRIDV